MKILYKDPYIMVINKPNKAHFDEVVAHSEKTPIKQPKDSSNLLEFKAVHRLDYESSGCLVFASPLAYSLMRQQFSSLGAIEKLYLAGATNELPQVNTAWIDVHGFVGSRYRSSKKVRFEVLKRKLRDFHGVQSTTHRVRKWNHAWKPHDFTGHLYEIHLQSGARHQIRAYFASCEAPLCGDPLYNPHYDLASSPRLELHAWKVCFNHPIYKNKKITVEAI